METKFKRAFVKFCYMAHIPLAKAFSDIGEASPGACVKKMESGWVPDDGMLEKLAEYFEVGMDEFKEDEERNRLCYLIGGISGNPDYLREFETARQYLESRGWHVCSPAHMTEMLPKAYLQRKHFMQLGIALLSICSMAAVMPGYEGHSGCEMEIAYAKATGIELLYLTDDMMQKKPVGTGRPPVIQETAKRLGIKTQ